MTWENQYYIDLGHALDNLFCKISVWSQKTFGVDCVRGPVGPLKHLEKEAREAIENPKDIKEYADCLILICDASRRAGFSILDVVLAAQNKMEENVKRKWPTPVSDEAVEHIKEN
jgi:hypothetical protein